MRLLLGQVPLASGRVKENITTIVGALDAHPDAEIAAFPELAITGYNLELAEILAVEEHDAIFAPIQDAALRNGTAVVVGFPERWRGVLANSAALIDVDGRWTGTYRKFQLFGAEAAVFAPGDELLVAELAGARVAPMICFDVEFPELARALARRGADLLVTIAANMNPYAPDHAKAAAARALDNRRPHLYVNHVGEIAGVRFAGQSAALTADGEVAAMLGTGPATGVCDIRPGAVAPEVDYLRLMRPVPGVRTIRTRSEERISNR